MSEPEVELDAGTPTLRAWVAGGVGVIELNRPGQRNALHPDWYDAIPRLIRRYDADDDVGCILLTAAGDSFCAGGDVRLGMGGTGLVEGARMVVMLQESPKISIAALPGAAVGAGVGVALATDLRIAARSARLLGGYARLGFSGDFGVAWLLTRLIGPARALEMLVDNAPVDADAALRLGLFNKVVPDDELRDAAIDWARGVAAGPRTAFGLMKENVRDALRLGLRDALVPEAERMGRSADTDYHREAIRRWVEEARARRKS